MVVVYNALIVAQDAGGGALGALLLPVLMIVLMYFLLIRPQQKQMKQQQAFRDSLKAGDRVITAGGVFGKVIELDQHKVVLEVAPKVKIRVMRTQVVQRQPDAAEATTESADSDNEAKNA